MEKEQKSTEIKSDQKRFLTLVANILNTFKIKLTDVSVVHVRH